MKDFPYETSFNRAIEGNQGKEYGILEEFRWYTSIDIMFFLEIFKGKW